MAVTSFRRRALGVVAFGVALPAVLLAAVGIFLTLRISEAVQAQSVRYNLYMARQVAEAFEQELLAHLRGAIATAENGTRAGADSTAIVTALESSKGEFEAARFVPLISLDNFLVLVVESTPVVYGPGPPGRPELRFVGMMLRDQHSAVVGAGGWLIDPRVFLLGHLRTVMDERLAANTRIYGGIESRRHLSIMLLTPDGRELARVRDPGNSGAASEPLTGPFEGYRVVVTATPNAPVAWTNRFVMLEVAFVALMGLVLLGATAFGLRYTVRQLELAQIKASFVSNVSHELKTPIALIRLAVETLEMRRISSPEESERFLRSISREAMRLNQLVDNILDFARLEAGQHVFQFRPVDLGELTRETVDSFRPRLEDQGFRLEVDVPDDLPAVQGDGTALAQCLLNLLDNAMKYSRTRREVKVSAGAEDGEVTVSVTDRGIGISLRDQRRIFEKFVRLETGLVHDVKGAGLGLSLVAQIMRAHGGRVEVASTLGEGSTFTLVLPAAKDAEAPGAESAARTAS